MKRLELSVAADADLFDILAYGTAVYGEVASDTYYAGLTDCFRFLCEHPAAGTPDENGAIPLRRWRYRQHRIFYHVTDRSIMIVRILHVAADAVRWMKDQP